MRSTHVAALALFIALPLAGCPKGYKDTDGVYKDATVLPQVRDFADPDGLDVAKGDKVDWKYFAAPQDGIAMVRVDVGDLFQKRHGITEGSITALNAVAETLDKARIVQGMQTYNMEFEVTKGERYYVKIEAKGGSSPYKMTLDFKDKGPDPCLSCGEDQLCKEGKCVDLILPPPPRDCDPECKRGYYCIKGNENRKPRCVKRRERKELCQNECERIYDVTRKFIKINYGFDEKELAKRMEAFEETVAAGKNSCTEGCRDKNLDVECLSSIANSEKIPTCKVPCGGDCRRNEYCDEDSNTCKRKRGNPCKGVSCPKGERCRYGKCKPLPPPPCGGECKKGFTCNEKTDKCEKKPLGPISCTIIQVRPQGGKSILLLNRGSSHKVVVGDTGTVPGVGSFKVTKVFPVRSNATIAKPAAALSSKKSCTIHRKGGK